MSKFIGRLVNLGISKEATRGAGGSPDFWIPKASENFDDKVHKARSVLSYNTINMEGNQAPVALKWAEGSIEMDLLSESFGLVLLNLLGSVSTADNGDSTYTHTYSLGDDNQHDSLCLTVKDPDRDLQFKLAMINSLSINIIPDDIVKVAFDVVAKNSDDSSNSVSYTAENKFVGRMLTFKVAATTGDLAAATAISLKSLSLTFNKNVIRDHVLGTVQAEDNLNQGFELFGEIELNLENDTYKDLMLNGTYRAVRIQLLSDETIGSGSETPEFLIDLSRVDFEQWEPNRANDEISKQTLQFKALYDITNSNVINDCKLVNTTSAY